MKFSSFGERFAGPSGINELMDDMGRALADALDPELGGIEAPVMLGGGNPAGIPGVHQVWRREMEKLMSEPGRFEQLVTDYDPPQGNPAFLEALAQLLRTEYGWDLGPENIVVTNGSQSGFFNLFNLVGGRYPDGKIHKILFPLSPEYIGYSQQSRFADDFVSLPSTITSTGPHEFCYGLDRERTIARLDSPQADPVAALCISRPANPTALLLPDDDVAFLIEEATKRDLLVFLDQAYGEPFPGITFKPSKLFWNPSVVLSLSLSKLGLPGTRTGIIIAKAPIVAALSRINAVSSLANGRLGQSLVLDMVRSGTILDLGKSVIQPYYLERLAKARSLLETTLSETLDPHNIPWAIHQPGGAFFLWLWFPKMQEHLGFGSSELHARLKTAGLLTVPGRYFLYGMEGPQDQAWAATHGEECLRLSYARSDEELVKGISILGTVLGSGILEAIPRVVS